MSSSFNITDVIVSSELTGKIDTTKWVNQANIVTPDFKKLHLFNPYKFNTDFKGNNRSRASDQLDKKKGNFS